MIGRPPRVKKGAAFFFVSIEVDLNILAVVVSSSQKKKKKVLTDAVLGDGHRLTKMCKAHPHVSAFVEGTTECVNGYLTRDQLLSAM